jgi:beta-ribofuranosylaminobenzene 5'-phosphate synthase
MLLAFLAGINEFADLGLGMLDLQVISGRGGASGVGCHAFFLGGAIWDGGHARQSQGFLPSGARQGHLIPPLLGRWLMPETWQVFTVMPDDVPIFADAEKVFFANHTPTRPEETFETLAAICHGVIPAIQLRDLALLRDSLNSIHAAGFKRREVGIRRQLTRDLLLAFQRCPTVAAGMSSLGPLLYVIVDRLNAAASITVKAIADEYGAVARGPYDFSNSGYEYRILQ